MGNKGSNGLFGTGQSGPIRLHFSNITGSVNPTNSIASTAFPVMMSCRKRDEALGFPGFQSVQQTVMLETSPICAVDPSAALRCWTAQIETHNRWVTPTFFHSH